MNVASKYLALIAVQGKVYAFGGAKRFSGGTERAELYYEEAWSMLPDMPHALRYVTGINFRNKCYVADFDTTVFIEYNPKLYLYRTIDWAGLQEGHKYFFATRTNLYAHTKTFTLKLDSNLREVDRSEEVYDK
jgi:hypothetical protein